MQDLLFHDGTVVTMNAGRSILERTSVAVRDGCIVEVGPAKELRDKYGSARIIDCERKAILPGLVDLHGYLGGSLLKSIGQNLDGGKRRTMLEDLLPAFTDEEWWAADAQLNALERLKMGTTCMLDGYPVDITMLIDSMKASGDKALEEAIGLAKKAGVKAERAMVEGRGHLVSDTILADAKKFRADVIVMGTHGRRGLNRLLMGSDAERVLRESHVPVLLISAKNANHRRVKA